MRDRMEACMAIAAIHALELSSVRGVCELAFSTHGRERLGLYAMARIMGILWRGEVRVSSPASN